MNSPLAGRPTWAEIDLDRLGANFRSIKAFCGDTIEYMAVVKANAYGHGAVECSKRLENEGVNWFAVATLEEGVDLRQAGVAKPILVLGGVWPGQEISFFNFGLTPVIFTLSQAERLNEAAIRTNSTATAHVKIDSGMNRIGFRPETARDVAENLARLSNIRISGLMTHFAEADRFPETEFTHRQIATFSAAVEAFLNAGHRPKLIDLANSPGAVVHPSSRAKMVRIGGLLYGLGGDVLPSGVDQPALQPVMSLCTKIALLKVVPKGEAIGYGRSFFTARDSVIATVPIGYNDGYHRALSNKAVTVVRGCIAPVVGRVSMDWVTIDVTDVPNVEEGEKVTLIGEDRDTGIKAEDLARKIGTISYEITCGISSRVPRINV